MGKAMMGTGESEGEKRATESAELALNNPLIDEYSLQGAKGLLVNITGGKDLKLFEVEEAVNIVRKEVDPECELIIGSITDSSLEGKMRVSIVATSLDGITPEERSVVSMVHRIHNRNYGYNNPAINPNALNNQNTIHPTTVTEGANALKIETTQESESIAVNQNEQINNSEVQDVPLDSLGYLENSNFNNHEEIQEPQETLNLTEAANEETEQATPKLFSDDGEANDFDQTSNDVTEQDNLISENEEEDYEIPAFLRKQKN